MIAPIQSIVFRVDSRRPEYGTGIPVVRLSDCWKAPFLVRPAAIARRMSMM